MQDRTRSGYENMNEQDESVASDAWGREIIDRLDGAFLSRTRGRANAGFLIACDRVHDLKKNKRAARAAVSPHHGDQ